MIGAAGLRPCTLVVCRGCCCGNPRKHPGADHAWQLERLRAGAAASAGGFEVRTTDCLGPCTRSGRRRRTPEDSGPGSGRSHGAARPGTHTSEGGRP
ncbi:hypothetical protein ACFWP7_37295 [Streptomyces sp. NPDC058470]|uniref:hypothetical protein n=1 Tax=Streptomyces sp. NPDC058470 TaxID=3346515 RepID=UPI00365F8CCB